MNDTADKEKERSNWGKEISRDEKVEWLHEARVEEKPEGNKEKKEIERSRTNLEQKSAIHIHEIRVHWVIIDSEDPFILVNHLVNDNFGKFLCIVVVWLVLKASHVWNIISCMFINAGVLKLKLCKMHDFILKIPLNSLWEFHCYGMPIPCLVQWVTGLKVLLL